MGPNFVLVIAGTCAGLGLFVWMSIWNRNQALNALHRWAKGQGLEVVRGGARSCLFGNSERAINSSGLLFATQVAEWIESGFAVRISTPPNHITLRPSGMMNPRLRQNFLRELPIMSASFSSRTRLNPIH